MQLNARIKHKRDTASNWSAKNPTPLDGEIIIVETTDGNTRVKIGDGSTPYNNLPFVNEDLTIQVSENTSNISTLTNTKVTGVTSSKDGNVVVFDGTGGRLIKDSGKSLDNYLLNEEILEATNRVSDVEVNQSVATVEALQTGLARVESNMIASVNGVKADASGNVNVDVTLTKDKVTSALGYTPLQTAPVTSVMGKTGAVTGLVTSVNGTSADVSGNVAISVGGVSQKLNTTVTVNRGSNASTTQTISGLVANKPLYIAVRRTDNLSGAFTFVYVSSGTVANTTTTNDNRSITLGVNMPHWFTVVPTGTTVVLTLKGTYDDQVTYSVVAYQ